MQLNLVLAHQFIKKHAFAVGFFLIFPAFIGFFFAHRSIINLFGEKVGNVLIKLADLNTIVEIKQEAYFLLSIQQIERIADNAFAAQTKRKD